MQHAHHIQPNPIPAAPMIQPSMPPNPTVARGCAAPVNCDTSLALEGGGADDVPLLRGVVFVVPELGTGTSLDGAGADDAGLGAVVTEVEVDSVETGLAQPS